MALRLIARGGRAADSAPVRAGLRVRLLALITPTFRPRTNPGTRRCSGSGRRARPDATQGKRPPWADAESLVIDATRELTTIERDAADAPWQPSIQAAYQARVDAYPGGQPPRDNGGGFHPATSTWTPLYYAMVSPAYLATRDASVMSQVVALRWTSALMGR